MEKQKLTKDEIASILNKHNFLGHSEWRFNYDEKVFSVYYADGYLDTDIARAIAKAYLRLEAKKKAGANSANRVKLEGLDQGDKVIVLGDNEPIKTIISNKLGNSSIEVSIVGNPDEAIVAKAIGNSLNDNVKEVADGLKEIFINAMGGKKDKSQSFEIAVEEVKTVFDTLSDESTKQKTDLDFLKESIEIVEVADGIRESIVDAMLDSKKKEIMKEIAQSNKAGEGIQYYTITKCTALQHIVHSGYPLIPEMLTCMLSSNHTTQHCATDKNGNRVNWS